MRRKRLFILLVVVFFIVIQLATGEYHSRADGKDLVGFPFRFYEYLGGKADIAAESRYIYHFDALIADMAFFTMIGVIIRYVEKLKTRK